MKIIRKLAFETNSSSCHSLTIVDTPNFKKEKVSERQFVYLDKEGWHWDGDDVEGFYSKLNYILAYIFVMKDSNEELLDFFHSLKESCLENGINTLIFDGEYYSYDGEDENEGVFEFDLREEITLEKIKEFEKFFDEFSGYIDHNSLDILSGFTNQDLIDVMFNENAVIHIDNDNYGYYNLLKYKPIKNILKELAKEEGCEDQIKSNDIDDLRDFYYEITETDKFNKKLEEKHIELYLG